MKIGRQPQPATNTANLAWPVALLLVFLAGLLLGNQGVLRAIQSRLPSLLTLTENAPAATLPTLVVDMNFANYQQLLARRDEAVRQGVLLPDAGDFLTATIRLDGDTIPITMRLLPGPAADLGDDQRWPYEVRTRQNRQLLGMSRFYLLDPAADNWLNQWAYSRSLQREGILTGRYQFVQLVFNGRDLGYYALLEGFGDEIMTTNGRPPGVILSYDPEPLWQAAVAFGAADAVAADPVAGQSIADWRYLIINPLNEAAIAQNEARMAQRDQAIAQLQALQRGEPAADLVDVERYGRFLALTDLWAATDALSPPNLRYYFNPDSQRLEPVGFRGNPLAGDGRLSWAATFNDPLIHAAYAREVERISDPAYLEALQQGLGPEMAQLQAALRPAAGDLPLPWPLLAERQSQLRASMNPIRPLIAHVVAADLSQNNVLQLDVANALNLPLEIAGVEIGGATFLEFQPAWLPDEAGAANPAVLEGDGRLVLAAADENQPLAARTIRLHLPLTAIAAQDQELAFTASPELRIATRIVGLEAVQWTVVPNN